MSIDVEWHDQDGPALKEHKSFGSFADAKEYVVCIHAEGGLAVIRNINDSEWEELRKLGPVERV